MCILSGNLQRRMKVFAFLSCNHREQTFHFPGWWNSNRKICILFVHGGAGHRFLMTHFSSLKPAFLSALLWVFAEVSRSNPSPAFDQILPPATMASMPTPVFFLQVAVLSRDYVRWANAFPEPELRSKRPIYLCFFTLFALALFSKRPPCFHLAPHFYPFFFFSPLMKW